MFSDGAAIPSVATAGGESHALAGERAGTTSSTLGYSITPYPLYDELRRTAPVYRDAASSGAF